MITISLILTTWVLWLQYIIVTPSDVKSRYTRQQAYETELQCKSIQEAEMVRWSKANGTPEERIKLILDGKTVVMFVPECWPDTVDPRK